MMETLAILIYVGMLMGVMGILIVVLDKIKKP